METLEARDLGRLINAVDDPHWSDKRDVALINVMARAGCESAKRSPSKSAMSNWDSVRGSCWCERVRG